MMALATIEWTPIDTWIVIVGALCAMSASLLGNYLVLRRMSMMGDAISHAVLPGLAIAFLITGARDSSVMLLGAAIVGVLTALFTQWIHTTGKVDQGASMGVVFTVLFALGLLLIVRAADSVDLDPGCVLYGAIEYAPLDTVSMLGAEIPRAALTNGGVLVLNAVVVLVLYKELKVSTFDPELATTLGINANLMHYVLMTLVAVTTVVAFESVGSILVIAMLIVPPAVARMLTDRLGVMIVLSLVAGAVSAGLGHLAAITSPSWFGFPGQDTITSGMMAVVAGLLLLVTMCAAPQHGVISRLTHRVSLTLRILREDLLGMIYRLDESGRQMAASEVPVMLAQVVGARPLSSRAALAWLRHSGALRIQDGQCILTDAGRESARKIVRSHRLWEAYLEKHFQVPSDHLHAPAERLEHVTTASMRAALSDEADGPTHDPHGRPIPPQKAR